MADLADPADVAVLNDIAVLKYQETSDVTWMFIMSTVVAFIFAFGIGANDVANSFGTSLGSGALTLRQAVCIAAVCEILGAVTLGAGVSDTILKKISDVKDESCWGCSVSENNEITLFMSGMAAALCAAAIFLLGATWFNMPVSTTHAVVGAVLGMTLVGAGNDCVLWGYDGLGSIIASWLVSPILAGILSGVLDILVRRLVLDSKYPLRRSIITMPIATGMSIGGVLLMVLLKNKSLKGELSFAAKWLVGLGAMGGVALLTALVGIPIVKRTLGITKEMLDAEAAGALPVVAAAPAAGAGALARRPPSKRKASRTPRTPHVTKVPENSETEDELEDVYINPLTCRPEKKHRPGSEEYLASLPIDLQGSINYHHLPAMLDDIPVYSSDDEGVDVLEETIEEVTIRDEDDLAAAPEWAREKYQATARAPERPLRDSADAGGSLRAQPLSTHAAAISTGRDGTSGQRTPTSPRSWAATPVGPRTPISASRGEVEGLRKGLSLEEISFHDAAMKKLGELAESNPTPEAILKALHDHPEIALPTLKEIGNYHSLSKGAQDEIVGYQSSYAPSSTGGGHKVLRRTLTRVRKALPPAPTLPPVPPHEQLFMYLQILTACLKSYAHGANDTSNAAGPYAAVQALYLNGPEECSGVSTPIWVLFFIGGGIVVGLSTWGYKVMETVGKGLISINFPRGFVIELGSTFAVVLASVAGMPVSSTHCQIGSVVAVGILQSRANVEGTKKLDWSVFRQIVISWIVTVPFAALAAAGLFSAFKPGVEV